MFQGVGRGVSPSCRDYAERRSTARRGRLALPFLTALLFSSLRADTLALWLFDEAEDRSAEIVPGKFGRALRPAAGERLAVSDATSAPAGAARGNLNLGAHDWTIECWLSLDAAARDEAVIFEFGVGPRGDNELVTRFTVLPHENAFAFTTIATDASLGVTGERVEYPNPQGPPAGVGFVQSTTLALNHAALPRAAWFHVALVHDAVNRELRLLMDGRLRAVAAARVDGLPLSDKTYVSLGRDGRRGRVLAGAIDELRISDHAVYAENFAPPASFGRPHDASRPALAR